LRGGQDDLENYFEEERRVKGSIYGVLMKLGSIDVVIDVGCGDSTRGILSAVPDSFVMCVDVRPRRIESGSGERLDVVVADARSLPLRSGCCSAVSYVFTLHEIDPQTHRDVILEAKRVARYVVVAEPSPYGVELYEEFWHTYRDAAKSVGLFEEYKPREYWVSLLEEAGLQVLIERRIKWRTAVPKRVLEEIISSTVEEWKKMGVDRRYIERIRSILGSDKEFKWSDIYLIVGVKAEELLPLAACPRPAVNR